MKYSNSSSNWSKVSPIGFLLAYNYFIFIAGLVQAQYTFRGNGYSIFPINNSAIKMVSENIRIKFREGQGTGIEEEQLLQNQGPAATVIIIFPYLPSNLELSLDNSPDPDWVPERFDPGYDPHLETSIEGNLIPWVLKRNLKAAGTEEIYPLAFTSELRFNANETKKLIHHYTVGGYSDPEGESEIKYILETGSYWKDPIGHIVIHAEINASQAIGINYISPVPAFTRRAADTILMTWEFREIEPDFNIKFKSILFLSRMPYDIASGLDVAEWIEKEKTDTSLFPFYRFLLLGINGYPFRNPYTWAEFYENGTFKVNSGLTIDNIPVKQRKCIQNLADSEAALNESSGAHADPLYENLGLLSRYNDLTKLNKSGLRLVRNDIYARHGRVFNDKELADYFSRQPWYKPDPGYSDNRLTEVDREIISYIAELEHLK